MTVPYTVTTPEYVKWAKKGEQDGLFSGSFVELVDQLIELVSEVDSATYSDAREKIKECFDLHECDR